MSEYLNQSKRIVIKIGSSLLVDKATGSLHHTWLQSVCQDVAKLRELGKQVVIVSSGAMAIGRHHLGLSRNNLQLEQQQAAAATGQIRLAHAYQAGLAEYDISVAQILLTLDDSENRKRYLNARNTIETLLSLGAVPVINENDTVATSEIRYGDNDRLSARVAQMISADTLILLSDIEGLYTADPRMNKSASLIPEVSEINNEILAMAGDSTTQYGSGGMRTKLAAAGIVMSAGCKMVIMNGHVLNPIDHLLRGAPCTWFLPGISPRRARKNWLAQHLRPCGELILDDGAVSALTRGNSLLAAGVIEVHGQFQKGDPVIIKTKDGKEIGRGLCNFPAHDARKIVGLHSKDIETTLGYAGSQEMIHRDDLVVL